MAVKLLQVLVLGVIAAAGDDVPVTWVGTARTTLTCHIPEADRIPWRRPPPPLEGQDRPRGKHYIWRHNGEDLKRSNSSTLEVFRRKNSTSSDGLYQCAVRHPAGGYVLGYPVNLKFAALDKLQLTVLPENSTAWLGQPHALTCNVPAEPPARVSWFKDGKNLVEDDRHYMWKNQLLITKIVDEDAGLYKCKASYKSLSGARVSRGSRVAVGPAPAPPAGLLPLPHEATVAVPRGGRAVLPCPTVGDPKPVLVWEMTAPGRRTAELESTDEVQVVHGAERGDAGTYVCSLEHDRSVRKVFNLTITTPVIITHPPESKQAVLASTVRFNCTATGHPTPKVTWYKDGKKLSLSGRIDVVPPPGDKTLLQLLIRSVTSSDAGVYQCIAHNSVSVQSSWVTLNVTGGKAAAPVTLSCSPAGARDVRLHWTDIPNVVAYTVHVYDFDERGTKSLPGMPVTKNETLVKVTEPLTPYIFRIRAYIGADDKTKIASIVSDMSDGVVCQGQGAPINLTELKPDEVLISWGGFAAEQPGVLEWILQYKSENGSEEHNVTLDGSTYNHTLKVSSPLQVRLLGTRSLPWLAQDLTLVPWTSTAAARVPVGDPNLADVEATEVGSRGLTVRWRWMKEMPSNETFTVCYRLMTEEKYEHCVGSITNTAHLSNLRPNSEYEISVEATQSRLHLPLIRVVTSSEAASAVGPPLTYKHINGSALSVTWRGAAPFTVRYVTDAGLPAQLWDSVYVATGDTVLLTNVDLSKNLSVLVEGEGPVGSSPVLTIPALMPEAAEVQYSYSARGVRVAWAGRGARTVRYSQNLTRPLHCWRALNVSGNTVEITDLDPSLHTFVMVTSPGPSERNHVLTIKPRPPPGYDYRNLYLAVGITAGVLLVCVMAAAVCVWAKRKRNRSPVRTRQRRTSHEETHEMECPEMRNIGGRLANGGGSKDAGEPLLNGHVHITENPSQSKTPNGKVRKYEVVFDVTRSDADLTQETDLDTSCRLLDTSRPHDLTDLTYVDLAYNTDLDCKLPDDNMNSEFRTDRKTLPTLQPNG